MSRLQVQCCIIALLQVQSDCVCVLAPVSPSQVRFLVHDVFLANEGDSGYDSDE